MDPWGVSESEPSAKEYTWDGPRSPHTYVADVAAWSSCQCGTTGVGTIPKASASTWDIFFYLGLPYLAPVGNEAASLTET